MAKSAMKIHSLDAEILTATTRTIGEPRKQEAIVGSAEGKLSATRSERRLRRRRPSMHEARKETLAGRYQLLECIGRGGMGEVHRARDLVLQREVAVKILNRAHVGKERAIQRFAREAQAMAALDSPYLTSIYDMGSQDEHFFLVMQYIVGPSMLRILATQGALPPRRVAHIMCQVLEALATIHEKGFVHRDVKPSNVLVDGDDHVTLVDLGIVFDPSASPLTPKGIALGTPAYMSPEQAAGKAVDGRSDLYAVGIMLMHALTGRLMLRGHSRSFGENLREHASRLPAPWAKIVRKALAHDPQDRFPSAASMGQAIQQALDSSVTPEALVQPLVTITGPADDESA